MKLDVLLMVLLALLFFGYGICFGQVSVIHFNSEWNAGNDFDITILKDCDIDSVVICHNPDLKDKYKIKAVPTVIVFDEEEEVARFEANIMMELEATKKDIQKEIDKIMLKKFE
jgi:methyl coenzyme M reductase subunit C|tara:strand:+ start:56 stop:397 length:342 start_codon:yes stop_codon:yes gene_type:complete